jgi:hypothetical protein
MQCAKSGAEIAASTDPAILSTENARLIQELAEARLQQAATGEILDISRLDDGIEHGLELGGRLADDIEHIARRRLVFERLLQLP